MKSLCLFISVFFFSTVAFSQRIPIPENYIVIDSVYGDLDKDGADELVAAYNTRKEAEENYEGVPRELIIYKKKKGAWVVWQQSLQALYGSRDGGMMGDPYGSITIEKGVLIISHNGGSSWKWSHTDKYRYNGTRFQLIGYTSIYGKPCEYWEEVDYNLVTGMIMVKKEYERCETEDQLIYKRENETFVKKGIQLHLQNRRERELKIISPKYKHEIYIATKIE